MDSTMDHAMQVVNTEAMGRQMNDHGFFDEAVAMDQSKEGPQIQTQTYQWLQRHDNPWTMPDAVPSTQPSHLRPTYIVNPHAPQDVYMDYRSTGMHSECETIPGDSGYGSCVPPSVENNSVYGEDPYPLPHNVEQDLGSFHLNLNEHLADSSSHLGLTSNQSSSAAVSESLQCEGCGETVRTKSELKKHELRHNKPFRCKHVNCNRYASGFASQNDRDRHYKTVHRNFNIGKNYICHHEGCLRSQPKLWPRADNFRSHLNRVHRIKLTADDDLSRYVCQSEPSPHISEDLSGVGTKLQEPILMEPGNEQEAMPGHPTVNPSIGEFPDIPGPGTSTPHTHLYVPNDNLLMPPVISRSQAQPSQPTSACSVQTGFYSTQKSHVPLTEIENTPTPMDTTPISEHHSPAPKAEPVNTGLSSLSRQEDLETDNESDLSTDEDSEAQMKDFTVLLSQAEAFGDDPSKQTALESFLRKVPAHLMQKILRENGSAAAIDSPEQTHFADTPGFDKTKDCERCGKQFKRPCELTKHLKRHSKPYGCTVYRCDKTFGSKNDWKRHEQGQHNPNESWPCDEAGCSESFNRRDTFEDHLREYHKLTSDSDVEAKLENNRRGSHRNQWFWCGFCENRINFESDKSPRDERFDHIDDHFMGRMGARKWNIQEWRPMEEPADKPSLGPEATRKRKLARPTNPRPTKLQHKASGEQEQGGVAAESNDKGKDTKWVGKKNGGRHA